ncbi:hypothetical protein N7456_001111 [Penicillium angulare]|uniref:Uncharacterized protein n=1 Tax=Penicillium angulare TaxID=116970 RepID=A0A9W9KSI5_9EURO|nr:hypothetical protein N7456_001111 [Penicillium angulare]
MKKRKLSPSSPPGNLSRISALTAAVRAFAFKFFITGTGSTQTSNGAKSQSQACHNSIWTEAIPLAKQAMKDRSYQSILTLYIIGLASLSINTPDKPQGFEAECFDSASRHIKVLRELERTDQDEDRRHQSEIAYWCVALTENACQLNQLQRLGETSLFSEKSQVWGVVRERTSLFHQSFKSLHGMREPMSKEVISAILQHATLHKCMTWWNMNNIKSYTEGDLDELLQTAARDMLTFRDVFTPLLDLVGRDFLMLNPKDQLSYVLVTVHFYWAVLLFIEEIDKRSPDPPVRHMISKSEASRSIVNTLSQAQLVYETSAYQPSVLLIDPMPETMVSCIVSAASALLELFGNGTFSLGACRTMLSVLVASLKVLCQISPNAKYALEKLNVETMQKSIFKSELASSSDMCKNGTQKLIS